MLSQGKSLPSDRDPTGDRLARAHRQQRLLVASIFIVVSLVGNAAHAFRPPPPPPIGEQLLLERNFQALRNALANQTDAILDRDVTRLFSIALMRLDAAAFVELYEAVPQRVRGAAITAAVQRNRIDVLEALRNADVDFDTLRTAYGGSIVTEAAHQGKIDVIEWAARVGVRPLPQDGQQNELTAASSRLYPHAGPRDKVYAESAFRRLEMHGYQPPANPRAVRGLLGQLVRFGDIEVLDRYVRHYKAKGLFDPNSGLIHAALSLPAVKYLEANGATLDAPSVDSNGRILRTNVLENHALERDAKLYLIGKGLKVSGQALAVVLAVEPADHDLIEALLKAGANPEAPDASAGPCGPPAHCVAQSMDTSRLTFAQAVEVLGLLSAYGARLDRQRSNGDLPVHATLSRCSWPAMKVWLDTGYDINRVHVQTGRTLLGAVATRAQQCGAKTGPLLKELVAAGADVNGGRPPALFDIAAGPYVLPGDLLQTLLDLGADVNAMEPDQGNTVLHRLVMAPLKLRGQCAISPIRRDPCPRETLDERAESIRLLVARGADPAQRNRSGTTALELARTERDTIRREAILRALGDTSAQ